MVAVYVPLHLDVPKYAGSSMDHERPPLSRKVESIYNGFASLASTVLMEQRPSRSPGSHRLGSTQARATLTCVVRV